jgi:hypothetical protein
LVKQFPVFLPRGAAPVGARGLGTPEDAVSQDAVKTEAFRLIEASPQILPPQGRR